MSHAHYALLSELLGQVQVADMLMVLERARCKIDDIPEDEWRAMRDDLAASLLQAVQDGLVLRRRQDVAFALLTPRQAEVVRLLEQGLSNADIARAMAITERTVRAHLEAVGGKLGVHSRTEILAVLAGFVLAETPISR